MTGWRRFILLAALALAGIGPAALAQAPLDRLERVVERLGAEGEFSGAVVIMKDGEELFAQGVGFADRARLVRFTPDTPSDTGSVAKSVTGTLVLLNAEAGRLALDDKVVRWLPGFPHPETTLRHLLTHSAGLPDYDAFDDLFAAGPTTNASILESLPARAPRPAFPPGTRFDYCNLCLDLLAEVVARAGGASYADQATASLLKPLGATTAFVRPARFADWPVPRTLGYRGTEPFDAFENDGTHGASNIIASARDLARWANGWAEGRAVPPAVALAATAGAGPGIRPGQWFCNEARESCFYTGHHQGFDALSWWDRRERLAIAFVANGGTSPWLTHRLARLLRDAALGRAPLLEPEPAGCRTQGEAQGLVGTWRLTDGSTARVELEDGRAWLSLPQAPRMQLYRVGAGAWYAPGVDTHVCRDGDRLLMFAIHGDRAGTRA